MYKIAVFISCALDRWETPYEGEKWGCNNCYKRAKLDKLFIMHKQVIDKGKAVFDWSNINAEAQRVGFEIIALHDIPVKDKNNYPYEEIVAYFNTDYFTSSYCYMIAYALYKGYEKIIFDNVSFYNGVADDKDSYPERCGVEYWIGRAQQKGVEVEIHNEEVSYSNLLTTRDGKPYAIEG